MNNITVSLVYNGKIHNLSFEGEFFFNKNFNTTFPCIYLIVQNTQEFVNKIIYVGVTEDINQRMSNHHKIDCWKRHVNSNSLYILKQNNNSERLLIESLIIQQYNPPCNG